MLDISRGSTWGKWDLHVHTPDSLVHEYPGDDEARWEAFIADLEALPREFRVIGVNDYLFISGYRRLLAEKAAGRLQNIETLLPVIELRLDKFGGTSGALSRVNLHVIFSESVDVDVIEQQFIAGLSSRFLLSAAHHGQVEWKGVVNLASLAQLGKMIKASVPQAELKNYRSDLIEGFNNLTISLEKVQSLLDTPHFRDLTILGVGRAEWADVKWTDQSIADKKNVINQAGLIFTASETPDAFHKARAALTSGLVNDRLLDCSDAHHLSSSTEKDRIGNCFTWINAAPTFQGLKHALREYEDRVFVGSEPALVRRVREQPTRFIDSIAIGPVDPETTVQRWFGADIPLNPGFSVVYGGKGQGKSALADIIALAGASSRESDFSFLTRERFRSPKDRLAEQFEVRLTWHSRDSVVRRLDESVEIGAAETVQYIPQNFLESICNIVPGGESGVFDDELSRVVFSHIPTEERLRQSTLLDLITERSEAISERIGDLRASMAAHNAHIASREEQLRPMYRAALENELAERQKDLAALEQVRPVEVPRPDEATDESRLATATTIAAAQQNWRELQARLAAARNAAGTELSRVVASERIVQRATRMIHEELEKLANVYRDVYRPVEDFIEREATVREQMDLNFEVSLVSNAFEAGLLDMLNQSASGSFRGSEEGTQLLHELLSAVNLNDGAEVVNFASTIAEHLTHDKRPGHGDIPLPLTDQLRRGFTPEGVWDYLFGLRYLEPRFVLQSRGRPLDQLSPGEKGTLLLLFYLVVDVRDTPLVIDQPEENLDNETVFNLLVSALKSTKARRQLIIVTHNPS